MSGGRRIVRSGEKELVEVAYVKAHKIGRPEGPLHGFRISKVYESDGNFNTIFRVM